jgi:hypothetical protein
LLLACAACAGPWWNNWPRITNDITAAGATATGSSLYLEAGVPDEGRGPFYRQAFINSVADDIAAARAAGLRRLAWIESMGQARVVIGALHQLPGGGFEIDPATGAPRLVADYFSWWRGKGCGTNACADANTTVWMGEHAFLNDEPWQGRFIRSAWAPAIPAPTYPDGTPAVGYLVSPADPRTARVYDALASKDLNGGLAWECSAAPASGNTTDFLALANGDKSGDCSIGKDVAGAGHDLWLAVNREAISFLLRQGLDGFWMDNASGWDNISSQPVHVAFGEHSVASFRGFLGAHHPAVIAQPAFDIRQYLLATFRARWPGANATDLGDFHWQDPSWNFDPMWRAYRTFKAREARRFALAMQKAATDEAKAQGRDTDSVLLAGNDVPGVTFGVIQGGEIDMAHTEYPTGWSLHTGGYVGHGIPPLGRAGGFYAAAVAYGRGHHAAVWYYLDKATAFESAAGVPDPSSFQGQPLLGEVVGYEALAQNVLLNGGDHDPHIAGNDASIAAVHATQQRLAPVFGDRERSAQIALVWSPETAQSFLAPGGYYAFDATNFDPHRPGVLDHNLGYFGWAAALESVHVPYKTIPDRQLTASKLAGVKALILPHVRAIDQATVDTVLEPYRAKGGVLVITGQDAGSVSTEANLYAPNARPLLAELQGKPNVYFVDGNPGFDFHTGRLPTLAAQRAKALNTIQRAVLQLQFDKHLQIELNAPRAPEWLLMVPHLDFLGGKAFVDFVNLGIDPQAGTLMQVPDVEVSWLIPPGWAGKALVATAYDADGAAPIVLPSKSANGFLTFAVGGFRIYRSVVIAPK